MIVILLNTIHEFVPGMELMDWGAASGTETKERWINRVTRYSTSTVLWSGW